MKWTMLALVALGAAGCADEMPRDVREATTPPRAETVPDTTVPGDDRFDGAVTDLPPGGYVDWLADIRQELPRVLDEAAEDRGEAVDLLQQLYIRRQQPLAQHFGQGGSAHASDAMAEAVGRLDSYFQELMRQIVEPSVPQERLRETVSELQRVLGEVEAEGTSAGLPPSAPRN